jgi:hypothetical protein
MVNREHGEPGRFVLVLVRAQRELRYLTDVIAPIGIALRDVHGSAAFLRVSYVHANVNTLSRKAHA